MPTYDYACDACGHKFEHFQSMTDKVLRKCPSCGKRKLQRLIGPGAGFIFRGSGFYITDYRSDSYKASEQAEKNNATTNGTSAKTKTDKTNAKPPKNKAKSTANKAASKANG